jgi:hypothetical protein
MCWVSERTILPDVVIDKTSLYLPANSVFRCMIDSHTNLVTVQIVITHVRQFKDGLDGWQRACV